MPEDNQTAPDTKPYEVVGPKKKRGKQALLWLLILLLIGGAGYGAWYYQQQNIDDLNQQIKQLQEAAKADKAPEKEIVKVQVVKSADNSFSVEAPVEWLSGTCEDSTIVFLAPSADLLGKCATEYFGIVSMSKTPGDNRSAEGDFADETLYSDVTFAAVTVNGVEGVRVSYTNVGEFEVGPLAGTKAISYQLFDGTSTYMISYSQQPSDPDYSEEFETITQSFTVL